MASTKKMALTRLNISAPKKAANHAHHTPNGYLVSGTE